MSNAAVNAALAGHYVGTDAHQLTTAHELRRLRRAVEQLAGKLNDAADTIGHAAAAIEALGATASVVEALHKEAATAREAARWARRQSGSTVTELLALTAIAAAAYTAVCLLFCG